MKMTYVAVLGVAVVGVIAFALNKINDKKNKTKIASLGVAALALASTQNLVAAEGAVPLKLTLPDASYVGTPKDLSGIPNLEDMSKTVRPDIMVPAGLTNIAPGAKLTTGPKSASRERLAKIVDGAKDTEDPAMLGSGKQWVQMTFDKPQEIYAIVIWHDFDGQRVYKNVVVQSADDADMIENVKTLFNNDKENDLGLGVGADRPYLETRQGKLLETKGIKARTLRFWSHGSTDGGANNYVEIEVYGRPAK